MRAEFFEDAGRAFKDTLPVMAGYIVLGIGFGVLLSAKGYGALWAFAMSVIIYAGSMQYVIVDMLSGDVTLLTVALTSFMLGARHLFYGISMVDRYRGAGASKPYMIYALTDETYSLVCGVEAGKEGQRRRYHRYCFLVSLFDHLYWIGGCVLGGLLGPLIPFNTKGIDFVLTALFVTIGVEQWLNTREHLPALAGFGATLVCLLLFGREGFLVPSMVAIAMLLLLLRGKLETPHE